MRQHIPRVIADSTCSVRQTITEIRVSRLMNLDRPVKPDRSRESALMDGNPKVSNSDLAQSRPGQAQIRILRHEQAGLVYNGAVFQIKKEIPISNRPGSMERRWCCRSTPGLGGGYIDRTAAREHAILPRTPRPV